MCSYVSLWCPYCVLISPAFCASGWLCFVIVTFQEYLDLFFFLLNFDKEYFQQMVGTPFPKEELNKTFTLDTEAPIMELDLSISIMTNGTTLIF